MNQVNKSPQRDNRTEVQKVTDMFIEDLRGQGLETVLSRIGGWYERAAAAILHDRLDAQAERMSTDPQVKELFYLRNLLELSHRNFTAPGDALLNAAMVDHCSRMLSGRIPGLKDGLVSDITMSARAQEIAKRAAQDE